MPASPYRVGVRGNSMARAKRFARAVDSKGNTVIEFMGPAAESDGISMAMRVLTQQLIARGHGEAGGGFFGGTYGYGVDFENEVFEMHPDWQGDCTCGATEPKHLSDCDITTKWSEWVSARLSYAAPPKTDAEIDAAIEESVKLGLSRRMAALSACGSTIDFDRLEEYEQQHPPPSCTCGVSAAWEERDEHEPSCRLEQHCFTYKPTGFVLDWYKYIGRDNEIVEAGSDVTLKDMLETCLRSIGCESLKATANEYEAAEREAAEAHDRAMKFWMSDESLADDAVDPVDGDSNG